MTNFAFSETQKMFALIRETSLDSGTFSKILGYTSDKSIAQLFVDEKNTLNEKQVELKKNFLSVEVQKWEKKNPEPLVKNLSTQDYYAKIIDWRHAFNKFIDEGLAPFQEFDENYFWKYEEIHELNLI